MWYPLATSMSFSPRTVLDIRPRQRCWRSSTLSRIFTTYNSFDHLVDHALPLLRYKHFLSLQHTEVELYYGRRKWALSRPTGRVSKFASVDQYIRITHRYKIDPLLNLYKDTFYLWVIGYFYKTFVFQNACWFDKKPVRSPSLCLLARPPRFFQIESRCIYTLHLSLSTPIYLCVCVLNM